MIEKSEVLQVKPVREKLWTTNFFLLWQGQLVSALGDVVYDIALGFWILAVTGSTALMGSLMAASALPRVLISPFAGVFVDRANRRNLLVLMDLIRGVAVALVAVAAYKGFLQIWMVFGAGIVLGVCGAFFNPTVSSAVPDIVPRSHIIKANSYFRMIYTATGIIGSSAGGFLFQVFGAPFLFLFNGISYLFSSFTEVFIKIPKIERPAGKPDFFSDLKEGLSFVWRFRGLRYLISIAAFLNFFATMASILILPLFERTTGLGPAKYGIAMAFLTGGMFAGMVFTSAVDIKPHRRLSVFMISSAMNPLAFVFFPFVKPFPLKVGLLVIAGFFNAIINVFFSSSVQLTVPQDKRGKVFGFMGMVLQGLTPLAMATGGILAEFLDIRFIISTCFAMVLLIFLPFGFIDSFRRFINFDPDKDTLEDIM